MRRFPCSSAQESETERCRVVWLSLDLRLLSSILGDVQQIERYDTGGSFPTINPARFRIYSSTIVSCFMLCTDLIDAIVLPCFVFVFVFFFSLSLSLLNELHHERTMNRAINSETALPAINHSQVSGDYRDCRERDCLYG